MSTLRLKRVKDGALDRVDLELGAGIAAVLAEPLSGGSELVAVSAGWDRPQRGLVLVDGADPFRSPDVRRKVGSLLADERAPMAPTVGAAVARVLSTRGDSRTAEQVLESGGLGSFSARLPSSLSPREARSLALALALAHPEPALLALHEPLAAGLDPDLVLRALGEHARRGAVVLAVTSSRRDAELLAGRVRVLQRGRFIGDLAAPGLQPALPTVVGTSDPRALSAALAAEPAVTSVVWDEGGHAGQLTVHGTDRSEVSLAILRASRSSGAVIHSITEAGAVARIVRPASPEGDRRGRVRRWAL